MKYLFIQLHNRKEVDNGSCIAVIPLHEDNVRILLGAEEMFKTFQNQYPHITAVNVEIDSFLVPSDFRHSLDISRHFLDISMVDTIILDTEPEDIIGDGIELEVGPYGIYFWDPEDHHWSDAITYSKLKDLIK